MNDAYKRAGVDLDAGYQVLKTIKQMSGNDQLGTFGGTFPLSAFTMEEPVLVAGTDGVGTKLLVASAAEQHTTIGIDLVAMCVNDVLAQGARPLFFLDYLGLGHTDQNQVSGILTGVITGCQQAQTKLIGGETAEMPDMYHQGHYDLAGFSVGIADRSALLSPTNVRTGDCLIGLPSNGLHANGFSLVRDILFKQHSFDLSEVLPEVGTTLADELLRPTQIYVASVWPLLEQKLVASIAHITGGGLTENVARALPAHLSAQFSLGSWPVPPIMSVLERLGHLTAEEMRATFNLGLGMVLIIHPEQVDQVLELLAQHDQPAYRVGKITMGETPVTFQEGQ